MRQVYYPKGTHRPRSRARVMPDRDMLELTIPGENILVKLTLLPDGEVRWTRIEFDG